MTQNTTAYELALAAIDNDDVATFKTQMLSASDWIYTDVEKMKKLTYQVLNTPLSNMGSAPMFEHLLAHGALDILEGDFVYYVSSIGRPWALEMLIEKHGQSPDGDGSTPNSPITEALTWGNLEIARYLKEKGAALNKLQIISGLGLTKECEDFFDASGKLKPEFLITEVYKPSGQPVTSAQVLGESFSLACRNKQFETAEYLLARGADINYYFLFFDNCTPLHAVAEWGDLESVVWLVEHGADVHAKDKMHCAYPLGWAKHGNKKDSFDYLFRCTTLSSVHDIISFCDIDTITRYLDDHPDEINCVREHDGQTPIFPVIWDEKLDLLNILLSRGADLTVQTKDKMTPLAFARHHNKCQAVIDMLVQAGAH